MAVKINAKGGFAKRFDFLCRFVSMTFAHIINPVSVSLKSELGIAQTITFEAIRHAAETAKGKVDVQLFTICYPEDHEVIPSFFTRLPNLNRSVRDVLSNPNVKKYPLMREVFQSLYDHSQADYFIFTNMDISLMPHFYVAVQQLVQDGSDALLINRRGISAKYSNIAELPLMYAELGEPHPGFDCFVFKRSLFPKLVLADICVGVSFSEVALVHNLIAFAEKLTLRDDLHLTFHRGQEVMPPLEPITFGHNRKEYETKIYPLLKPFLQLGKFPYSSLTFPKRMLKWALNPSFRTHQLVEMEGKSMTRKMKHQLDVWRFRWLERLR